MYDPEDVDQGVTPARVGLKADNVEALPVDGVGLMYRAVVGGVHTRAGAVVGVVTVDVVAVTRVCMVARPGVVVGAGPGA